MKSAAISAFPYRTQAVRDLAWACFSTPLLRTGQLSDGGHHTTDCGLDLNPERRYWLQELDRRPGPLLARLATRPGARLGIYFEQLWQFFLEQDSAVDLVAHNLPVRDGGRTLGEFDILYWCRQRQRHFHLELAVKFYLGYREHTTTETASDRAEWLGPNARDRLDLKIDKLLQHQSRLGEQPLARAALAKLGIGHAAPEIAIRGYLFQSSQDPLPPPRGFNTELDLSVWLPLDYLPRHLGQLRAESFLLLPKARWLTPAVAQEQGELSSRSMLTERLQSLLAADSRARLVAVMGAHGQEQSRFFVTANNWPATARAPIREKT